MGLASSQARLLNLTSRMHDIEYKAQKLEAQKLQMANESTQVYQEYENALNTTKLQLKKINDDGSAAYVDASYENLTEAGYYITMLGTGLNTNVSKLIVTTDDETLFKSLAVNSPEKFAAIKSGMCEVRTVSGLDSVVLKDTHMVCIFTEADLRTHAGSNATKILMNDLEFNTTSGYIGDLSGTLDGNGHTIKVTGSMGLFENLQSATVKNLNLELDITSANGVTVGGLAYNAAGTTNVENVNLTGTITSKSTNMDTMSSLIRNLNSGANVTITNVSSYVDITQTVDVVKNPNRGDLPIIGGLVAYSTDANLTITDSIYNGSISSIGGGRVGGIMGVYTVSNPGHSLSIKNCSTSGSITSTGGAYTPTNRDDDFYAGGIIGQIGNNSVDTEHAMTDCFDVSNNESSMNIDISGIKSSSNASGVVGYIFNKSATDYITGTISNNYVENVQLNNSVVEKTDSENKSYINQYENEIYMANGNHNYSSDISNVSSSTSTCTATGAKTSTSHDHKESSQYNYYLKIGEAIESGNYIVAENYKNVNNSTWLSEMLNSAYILLSKMDSDNNVFEVNVATDTSLQEVSDETLLKKAEAKYEADMRKINQKDKKFDTELAAMDAERNAVKTEMDTLKSVAKENVDRTFKLFG